MAGKEWKNGVRIGGWLTFDIKVEGGKEEGLRGPQGHNGTSMSTPKRTSYRKAEKVTEQLPEPTQDTLVLRVQRNCPLSPRYPVVVEV